MLRTRSLRDGGALAATFAVGLALLAAVPTPAPAAPVKVEMSGETKKATARALEWLAKQQQPDGSFSDSRYPHNTAITAYALIAFLSQGHIPGEGQYGPEVAKGARFLLAAQRDDGYIIGQGGNMYCHAMSTLALTELWGMTGDEEIKPAVKKAIDLIIGCQTKDGPNAGGWRYNPQPGDADISVTIMQVMALRAAKNSGLHVPDKTLELAQQYIEKCYEPGSGGFRYQPFAPRAGFARTAAGVCVLELLGKWDAKQVGPAVQYLKNHFDDREHFWYGHYYAAHAMHLLGGQDWADWYHRLETTLLRCQTGDGSWSGRELDYSSAGPVYQTAIAVIVLSVPAHYLPIYQR